MLISSLYDLLQSSFLMTRNTQDSGTPISIKFYKTVLKKEIIKKKEDISDVFYRRVAIYNDAISYYFSIAILGESGPMSIDYLLNTK